MFIQPNVIYRVDGIHTKIIMSFIIEIENNTTGSTKDPRKSKQT